MSPRLRQVTCDDLVRALKRAGFEERRQRGSHLHMWRSADNARVTIPVHPGRTVPTGTLRAILRDAGLSMDELADLL